jgi:diaminopimelate decarboxylase
VSNAPEIRNAPAGPWPRTAGRDATGELTIGGVSLAAVARRYGTPTYLFDEATIRQAIREFRTAFANHYPRTRVVYAGKAYLAPWLVAILDAEGIGLDVVSGGELAIGLFGGMPAGEISLHGNNKSRAELAAAITAGVGKIIVDNDHEIDLLADLTATIATPVVALIRVNPGVDVHTHRKISTGVADSKFGFPIADGQAEATVARLQALPGVRLAGLHAHVGSQLMESDATTGAIDSLLEFAAAMREAHGFVMDHLSPGGGFGIAYTDADQPLPIDTWAATLAAAVRQGCERIGLDLPELTIEPGRAIIGPAGVALYTVGSAKALPGIRTYVSVDGGMADNIRPALYEARYQAALASRAVPGDSTAVVTIAGKFCESGDVLIDGVELPAPKAGDLLAIPAAGAYTLSMASNYNAAPRPAVVLVNDGEVHCVRTRETWQDLVQREHVPRHLTT